MKANQELINGVLLTEYDSVNIRVKAPEGNFYFIFDSEDDKLVRIYVVGGKSGSTQAAWLDSFCRVISRQLERNLLTIEDLKEEFSSTRSDKSVRTGGVEVTSVAEAFFVALCRFTDIKFKEYMNSINDRLSDQNHLYRR